MRLVVPIGSLLLFCAAACASEDVDPGDDDVGGKAGASAGKSGGGGSSAAGKAGSTSTGGSATAGSAGNGTSGSGLGGSSAGTTAAGSGGAIATGGSAGASAGTSASGAGGSDVPVGGSAGMGGRDGGAGGVAGSGVSGSGGGGNPVSMSDLPTGPGDGTQPKPSGTPGEVMVVNWAGFKGAVSYSFDDANSSQISNFTQILALDVPFTWYLWTGKSESGNAVYGQARDKGHELGNHTQSHNSNGTAGDIDAAQSFIKTKWNVTAYTMAAPNGAGVYTNLAKPTFIINRGVSNKVIMPNDSTDPFTLPTYIPPTGANESAFNGQVNSARSQGGWVTMCIHGFSGGSDGAYQPVSFDGWKTSVERVKGFGDVWIGTIEDVGAYWLAQKSFSDAQTTTSGTDTVYTWTLPANFPPGKYLRVKTGGGTLKQDGVEIPWDGHGYYEIALDKKTLTVSP